MIKNLPDPVGVAETASKNYVDNNFNDLSIRTNTIHVDFNDKNLDNLKFVGVHSSPAVGEHLTPKYYVYKAIDELTLVITHRHSDFENNEFFNIRSIFLNSDPIKYNHASRKHYLDQAISNAIDEVTLARTHQHSDFENNELSNTRSIILNSDQLEYNHAARKQYVDNNTDESSLLRLYPDEKFKLDEQQF